MIHRDGNVGISVQTPMKIKWIQLPAETILIQIETDQK